jgi:hypothetical protein
VSPKCPLLAKNARNGAPGTIPTEGAPILAKNAKERGTHCVGNARKIKSPGHPAPIVRCRTRPRSFAKNAQDFGCGLPPSTALRVTPAMRLKFIDFRLGLRLHARNSR